MTAEEMATMIREIRNHYGKIETRSELDNMAYYLYLGYKAIGKKKIAQQMWQMYEEMEAVDSCELSAFNLFERR